MKIILTERQLNYLILMENQNTPKIYIGLEI